LADTKGGKTHGIGRLMAVNHGLGPGGSGLEVIVVVNQNSTNSVQLGQDYCELRGVTPQQNLLGWPNGPAVMVN